ncbi:type II toxin-antitoxin system HicA family toxin [Nostoc sp. UHCC 0926]|uniref:type II toxin-antitoxin system HicA family toxin n=1 Tax=unclassified Nostoc TaxID=2593658 RepID=UPI00235F81EA|nr:type II toxin-antitoxin system HicA family toxin [Nostoc sp. UHCC 0926]WDD31138.1 type II toxin-antitoxin system HicA family toxin [Nostoc sp. UHCC 0926]
MSLRTLAGKSSTCSPTHCPAFSPFSSAFFSALERDGWIVVRQRGSHIRLQKSILDEVLKLTVPAY